MSKISKRAVIYTVYCAVGAALSCLGMLEVIPDFFSSLGIVFITIGIMQLLRLVRYKADENYAKKMEIMQTDERNLYLAHKARSIAFAWGLVATAVAVIVFEALELTAYAVLCSVIMFVFVAIYLCSWWVLQKKG